MNNYTRDDIRTIIDIFFKTNANQSKIPFIKNVSQSKLSISGITVPLLRKLNKSLCLAPFDIVLKTLNLDSLDEQMLYSFCCSSYSKTLGSAFPFEDFVYHLLFHVDSWVVTDSVDCPLFVTDKDACLSFCTKLLSSDSLFHKRTAFILEMKYLASSEYIPFLKTSILSLGNTSEYYIQMAIAWLLQSLYASLKPLLLDLLADQNLCLDIKLKAISKLVDSRKTSSDDKVFFKQLRTNLKSHS